MHLIQYWYAEMGTINYPIIKKGFQLIREKYRGIKLLCAAYKIVRYNKEKIGSMDREGFWKDRSTIDHLFVKRQTMKKAKEFDILVYQRFNDLKTPYDYICRDTWLFLYVLARVCWLISITGVAILFLFCPLSYVGDYSGNDYCVNCGSK